MRQEVTDLTKPDCCGLVMQGGVVRFPLQFQSGIMRARFNPADGQLYVAGLRGWQTTGVKNGCFQRVRYTGAPVPDADRFAGEAKGDRADFRRSLDTQSAADLDNWHVEVWNYLWSAAYGSPEVSTLAPAEQPADAGKQGEGQFSKAQMAQVKHDPLAIKSVSISTDERKVFLEIPDLQPVMQMSLKYHAEVRRRRGGEGRDREHDPRARGLRPFRKKTRAPETSARV